VLAHVNYAQLENIVMFKEARTVIDAPPGKHPLGEVLANQTVHSFVLLGIGTRIVQVIVLGVISENSQTSLMHSAIVTAKSVLLEGIATKLGTPFVSYVRQEDSRVCQKVLIVEYVLLASILCKEVRFAPNV